MENEASRTKTGPFARIFGRHKTRQGRALGRGLGRGLSRGWAWAALAVAVLILTPILAVAVIALFPTENIWPHLVSTTLPRYFGNTAKLALGAGLLSAVMGTATAWLVSIYDFPGRRWLEWLLLLPLAVPAYIGAYALADFLDYSGPVQIALRETFGWSSARDYWFPKIRSLPAAVLVLSAASYPYIYLLTRAAFHEQSGSAYEVARALGTGRFALFRRVGLPLARPAIVAGVAIVMMESIADYGVVSYFGVQTLNTGIFTTWLEGRNAGGAAQIALMMLAIVMALLLLERRSRRHAGYHQGARQQRPISRQRLGHVAGLGVMAVCALPFLLGFVLPVAVISKYAFSSAQGFSVQGWFGPGLMRALGHTVALGAGAAIVTLILALVMVYGARLSGLALPRLLLPVTAIGYAAPGAVLAVGILFPLAAVDHRLADLVQYVTGTDPGLMLTGTGFAILLAYVVRFFALAQGAVDAAFTRIPPSLPMAARSLGRRPAQILREIYLPLMKGSLGSALLLVFVDCTKELPATLLLRPFNFETLATRTHERASLEDLSNASPAALLVMLVGLSAVLLLARTNLGLHKRQSQAIASSKGRLSSAGRAADL